MKLLVTLNEAQMRALEEMMDRDLQVNKSAYIGYLIAQEYKQRKLKKK